MNAIVAKNLHKASVNQENQVRELDQNDLDMIAGGASTTTCTNYYRLNGNLKKTVCTTTSTD